MYIDPQMNKGIVLQSQRFSNFNMQPSEKDLLEQVILKIKAVRVPTAEGTLPKIWILKGAIWCNLGGSEGLKIVFHLHSFIYQLFQ